jgi:hypothetical protein
MWRRARLEREAVKAERRLPVQAAWSWQTQELVPLSNTPAPLGAV